MTLSDSNADSTRKVDPFPVIPLRNNDGEIDVNALQGQDLEVLIKKPDLQHGQEVFLIWRGVGVDGTPFDELGAAAEVPSDYDPAVGLSLSVKNAMVEPFKDGWAFCSYKVGDFSEATPDSLRLRCYLGVRDKGETLAVVQGRESHDRVINWNELETEGVLMQAPPYQAMQPGHRVELVIRRFDQADVEQTPVSEFHEVTAQNVGLPLLWPVSRSEFTPIRGGRAEMHYQVPLDGNPLDSPVQVFEITEAPSATPVLGAPTVDGYTGDPLDPDKYPQGVMVRVPAHPDMQAGDFVLLHWRVAQSADTLLQVARMDASSLEAKETLFLIGPQALQTGNNNVFYQYGRDGRALTSDTLTVVVEAPRNLIAPIIDHAIADGTDKQVLNARNAIDGAYVNVPEFDLRSGESIEVHWLGHPNGGQQVVREPEPGTERRYKVDPGVVAANMHQPGDIEGRRFTVRYKIVDSEGAVVDESSPVNLRVAPLAPNPTMACPQAEANGDLKRSRLTANGAQLLISGLGLWSFAAPGQLLTIRVDGLASGVLRNKVAITVTEFEDARVQQWLSRAVYEQMTDNLQYTVSAEVSYDKGDSWHALPTLKLTPRKTQ
ncbi:hypothetical protein [Pseudomonas monteilii]|uniref:hypothetical protein n=1 Tax=Pseudomonas monteilii TaxID=76759 RepID=UPI001E4A1C91|nr:hypothetical protein [Pseudomonas monteilii]MCE1009750.1 hypothetical protein [Pseudomonas monteilii]